MQTEGRLPSFDGAAGSDKISIAVVQAGGQDDLEHSSTLLLDPFNADRYEHLYQRNSSRSVENCRQEEKEGHV